MKARYLALAAGALWWVHRNFEFTYTKEPIEEDNHQIFPFDCDFVFIQTPHGVRQVPIPTNRPYTDEEQEELGQLSAEIVSPETTPVLWAIGVADLYRILRDLPDLHPVLISAPPELKASVDEEDLSAVILGHENVTVVTRFTDSQSCVVVSTTPEECDQALSYPRYQNSTDFTLHWAGVGRDFDLYRTPFITETGETLL